MINKMAAGYGLFVMSLLLVLNCVTVMIGKGVLANYLAIGATALWCLWIIGALTKEPSPRKPDQADA